MNTIAVLGGWHLGSVTAAGLAEAGHQIALWDADPDRRAQLAAGRAPVSEPGLDGLLASGQQSNRLRVEDDLGAAVRGAELVWIAQDTRVRDDDTVDLDELEDLIDELGPLLEPRATVVVSSQVPVGTCQRWWRRLERTATGLTGLVCQPENLRLGAALDRFRRPDLVVIGSTNAAAGDTVEQALAFTDAPVVRTDLASAELIKHGINSFLATSIVLANELADAADRVGADAFTVARAMRLDPRIGAHARILPGLAFAGGTLARDVTVLSDLAPSDQPALLADAILASNHRHLRWPVQRLRREMNLAGARIAVLGLTYTVGTSTLRRAQSVPVIRDLAAAGATVIAHDPQADPTEIDQLQPPLPASRAADPYAAVAGCDAVVLLTPWPEYQELDWVRIGQLLAGRLVLDGPNALDPDALRSAGLDLIGPGRTSAAARPTEGG